MPVKIRLQRRGRKKSPFYHIVVADARAPRDGRFIEKLGTYNPMTKPATIELNRESAYEWLMKGAQPTDTARAILRFKGVMYRKHLERGVAKGALTQEQAMEKYQAWIDVKEEKIAARRAETNEEIRKFHEMINGKAPAKKAAPVKSELTEGTPAAAQGAFADSVEQTTIESLSGDAPAEEAAPVAKEKAAPAPTPKEEEKAPVAEEAPAAEKPAPVEEKPAKEEAPAVIETPTNAEPSVALGEVTDKAEAAAEEVAPVVEEAAAPVVEEAAAPAAKEEAPAKGDDLTIVEGIGPKIGETLTNAGITTFTQLAEADVEKVKEILAENKLASHDPTTWGKQAKMAADGEWDALKKWQDELDGGKEVK